VGLPYILKVCSFTIQMMYIVCLAGFFPGTLDVWLTSILIAEKVQFVSLL